MRIVALGDTHGRDLWKRIVDKEFDADKIIFIGDYFDTHEHLSAYTQIKNFEHLINLKELVPDKIELLMGNHDYHYMRGMAEESELYSGYQTLFSFDIQDRIHNALDKNQLSMCFTHETMIFSHAGITKTWLINSGYKGNNSSESIQTHINDLFKYKPLSFRFTAGENWSEIGDDITQSPIWVRPNSLLKDCLDNYQFVVGHTTQHSMTNVVNKIYLIDTIGTSQEYFVWEDGKITFQKL